MVSDDPRLELTPKVPLTVTANRNARAGKKPLNSGGMFLLVNPNGSRWWRLKYRCLGKEKQLSLGIYPEVSLQDARDRRDEARKQLAKGVGPSEQRKAQRSAGRREHRARVRGGVP